jgi:hypothetical protein
MARCRSLNSANSRSERRPLVNGVATMLGATAFTVTSSGASSTASARVNPTTPAFDVV